MKISKQIYNLKETIRDAELFKKIKLMDKKLRN